MLYIVCGGACQTKLAKIIITPTNYNLNKRFFTTDKYNHSVMYGYIIRCFKWGTNLGHQLKNGLPVFRLHSLHLHSLTFAHIKWLQLHKLIAPMIAF